MVSQILLLDIAPDPVSTGDSVAGIVLIGIVILLLNSAGLTGFLFLLKRFTRTADIASRVDVGDACLNLDGLGSRSNHVISQTISALAQPENSPNQP